jgi:hypothetical protein
VQDSALGPPARFLAEWARRQTKSPSGDKFSITPTNSTGHLTYMPGACPGLFRTDRREDRPAEPGGDSSFLMRAPMV